MADESELIKLREELKRSRRRSAFGFVTLVFALVVCLLYAFVQQVAATKNSEKALRQHEMSEKHRKMAESLATESQKQRAIAEEVVRRSEEELAKCKGKK